MADYRRELVFTVHQSEQALAYIDVSARHGEGIDEIAFRNMVESVRPPPMRMGSNTRSYSAEVALDFGSVAVLLVSWKSVSAPGTITHANFVFVRHAGKPDRSAGQSLLCIGAQM